MMSNFAFIIICIVTFLIQSSVFPFFFNGVFQPDLWLTLIIIFALIYDKKQVFLLTVIGGLSQDIVTGNFLGLHIIPYLFIAFVFSALGRERYNRHWYVTFLAVVIGSVVYVLLSGLIDWAGTGSAIEITYFTYIGAYMIAANGVLSLILHPILWGLRREGEILW